MKDQPGHDPCRQTQFHGDFPERAEEKMVISTTMVGVKQACQKLSM